MKKVAGILLCMMLCYIKGSAQQINKYEYFIDSDPGIGNGAITLITQQDSTTDIITLNTNGLTKGFHRIYIRYGYDNGVWGIAEDRAFFLTDTAAIALSVQPAIVSGEYFIDQDPGTGNGLAVPTFSPSDSFTQTISFSTTSLSIGFHRIYIRYKDAQNNWGEAEDRAFFVYDTTKPVIAIQQPMVAAEYYFDTDPGPGKGHPLNPAFAAADSVNITALVGLDTLPIGLHTLNIRFRNSANIWGIAETRQFTVCTTNGAKSDFEFAIADRTVSFINTSSDAVQWKWKFGDNDTSRVFNPSHTYLPGNYNACLITSNSCSQVGGDTLCKQIAILGLRSISPDRGGNSGAVSVTIKGGGFTPGTKFWLRKPGQAITGDTLIIEDAGTMRTRIDLQNKTIGAWDVIVRYTTGDTLSIPNGFTIEKGLEPNLWVSLSGNERIRPGFKQIQTITYGNKGNIDAYGVPVFIEGIPVGSKIEFVGDSVDYNLFSGFDTLNMKWDSIPELIMDSSTMTMFTCRIISTIPANSTGTLKFIIILPNTFPIGSNIHCTVSVATPLLTYDDVKRSTQDCITEVMEFAFSQFLDALDLKGVSDCIATFGTTVYETISEMNKHYETSQPASNIQNSWSAVKLTNGWINTTIKCAKAAGIALIPELAILKKALVVWKLMSDEIAVASILTTCDQPLKELTSTIKTYVAANSLDPNEKYGPGSNSTNHYTIGNTPMVYQISFENDTSANLPAQTVRVIDTLDKTKFDLSTFAFNSISVADSNYNTGKVKSFSRLIDFTSSMGVKCRATGTMDTATGIIYVLFNTIDPLTGQETQDALSGFLPPDTLSPKGQGSFTYQVEKRKDITDGDSVSNRAYIYFDFNQPIATQAWENKFDTIKPQSSVTSLTPAQSYNTWELTWSGTDNLSGIESYRIYYRKNSEDWKLLLQSGRYDTTATFTADTIGSYSFYSVATDSAGNIEDAPPTPDASTYFTLIKDIYEESNTMLYQNVPNPFYNNTAIPFSIPSTQKVNIKLLDLFGREIQTIADTYFAPGKHTIELDLSGIAPGLYYYQMVTNKKVLTRSLLRTH